MNDREFEKKVRIFQKNEITEYHIYQKIAEKIDDPHNSKVLREIAEDEYAHYKFWEDYSNNTVKPNRLKVYFYYLIALILGVTFGIKLMEKGEEEAQESYAEVTDRVPHAAQILDEEDEHETRLLNMLEEERLQYVGSVVLGLNDALVELTGTLAGLTFALKNTGLIAVAGLITGIAASLSMGASEYLSTKSESEHAHALKSSFYTGGRVEPI